MLRPRPCRWFELIGSRDDLAAMLAALARAGAVELQTHEQHGVPLVVGGAARLLEHAHELAKTCGMHWPAPRASGAARIVDPAATLAARVAQLDAWRVQAEPLMIEHERLAAADRASADLARLLAAGAALLPAPDLLAGGAGVAVEMRIYAMRGQGAASERSSELPADALQLVIPAGDEDFVIVVAPRGAMAAVDDGLLAGQGRRVAWPADLLGSTGQAARELTIRRAASGERRTAIETQLQGLALQHDLAGARADIELIEWLIHHGGELSTSERLVWVTGWTTLDDAQALSAPLAREGLRCVVRLSDSPPGIEAPSLLRNPRWVRPFEAFARMLGQPGPDEADPSPLVALIAPLLFGFMFGDVGQGALLCAAGWLLRKRAPMLLLLVPGGVMAMVFGLLFGSVFAREDLIPALWLHPLHEPLLLLGVAIGFGALILLAGLLLNAVQAYWRHEARRWWAGEAGLVLAYVGLLLAAVQPMALWAVPAGIVWVAAGSAWEASGQRALALATGLAQFVEHALQLLVNTVSFARVGAFALAHAGLSVAVVGVAQASGTIGGWIVLLLGNALILVLEGLVVGIQTTRLLLFEFFVRFLQGHGRPFRPLAPPLANPTTSTGSPI